jgi:c(7)-type cytochrome triheme protein
MPAPLARRAPVAALAALSALLVGAAVGGALGDLVLDRHSSESGVPAVVFPHWKHRTKFRCYACHPDPFAMQAGANPISMDRLRQGQFCARCHDGRVAFAVGFETCNRCHSHPVE